MPRLTIAVDITASARTPGREEVDRVAVAVGQHVDEREEHEQQHRDAERQQHRLAPPQGEHELDRASARRPPPLDAASFAPSRLREAQEHVLEALAPGPQVGERQVVLGQPGRERGDVGGRGRRLARGTRPGRPRRRRVSDRPSAAVSRPGGAPKRISSPPAERISSAGVPLATTVPWSMITTRSASRSASSSSWVVSSTQTPAAAQVPDDLADHLAAGDVDAGGGLVEERDLGPADQGERRATAAAARRPTAAARWRRLRWASPTRSSSAAGSSGSS